MVWCHWCVQRDRQLNVLEDLFFPFSQLSAAPPLPLLPTSVSHNPQLNHHGVLIGSFGLLQLSIPQMRVSPFSASSCDIAKLCKS